MPSASKDMNNLRIGIAFVGWSATAFLLHWSNRDRERDDDGRKPIPSDVIGSGEINEEQQSLQKFPWEPDATQRITKTRKLSAQKQQQQLDFLSSMTFSNGGIRAPSCPCCQ